MKQGKMEGAIELQFLYGDRACSRREWHEEGVEGSEAHCTVSEHRLRLQWKILLV